MSNPTEDRLFSVSLEKISDFVFDEKVVRVFRDMISRSVPGYGTLLSMLPVIVRHFVQPGSQCYDLGCSLGTGSLAVRHSVQSPDVRIIAIDNSPDMVASCQAVMAEDHGQVPVDVVCGDVRQQRISNASLVMMNFTLQFIEPDVRGAMVQQIYNGLNPGGVFVLSEKIHLPDESAELMTRLHEEFKRANGYSELEISQKRSALENVLITETMEQHSARLRAAGFSQVMCWFQCFNFVSLLAVKA